MQTTRPRVIVWERWGIWAAGLRRHLPREIHLRETRHAQQCLAELTQAPRSIVAVEADAANVDGVLNLLLKIAAGFPMAAVVVLADRPLESYEWLLRESGAVHFATSPRQVDAVARLVLRHAARVPQARTPIAAQIWESLPWPEAAR